MKVVELHADDLIDREFAGSLSPDERAELDQHLARCATCRVERQLRLDFDLELAERDEPRALNAFIMAAIREAEAPRAVPSQARRRAASASMIRPVRRRWMLLAVATLVFGTGVAAAKTALPTVTWGSAREAFAAWLGPAAPPTKESTLNAKPIAASANATVVRNEPAAGDVEINETWPRLASSVVEPFGSNAERVNRSPVSTKPRGRAEAAAPGALRASPAAVVSPPAPPSNAESLYPPPPENAVTVPVDTASSLFERANTARRQGDSLGASASYRQLEARFPESREAKLSLAIVARMQLDRHETAAALASFEAYYASGDGALREEAMEGRAVALQRLGRTEEEKQAWQELLRTHPHSAYAPVARQRLAATAP